MHFLIIVVGSTQVGLLPALVRHQEVKIWAEGEEVEDETRDLDYWEIGERWVARQAKIVAVPLAKCQQAVFWDIVIVLLDIIMILLGCTSCMLHLHTCGLRLLLKHAQKHQCRNGCAYMFSVKQMPVNDYWRTET